MILSIKRIGIFILMLITASVYLMLEISQINLKVDKGFDPFQDCQNVFIDCGANLGDNIQGMAGAHNGEIVNDVKVFMNQRDFKRSETCLFAFEVSFFNE